jgi:PAS domain S-box-containing protein
MRVLDELMTERMGRRLLKPWQAYLFATSVTAITLGVRLALDAPLRGQPTLIMFAVPIMLSAYLGGLYAGLLATGLTFLAASYFLLPLIHSEAIAPGVERWQQFFVALAGVVISVLNEALHRARQQAFIANREHQQAEMALRESESRYRTLFERAPDGILIADIKGYYLDTNAAMCRMLGYAREELIGLHSSDIVAPAEIAHIDPALEAIRVTADYHREWQFQRKDGSTFAADVVATRMPDGSPLAMVRDLTERNRGEEERQRLVALAQVKSEFLANMSHELRTPLNAIIGFAELMHRGRVGPVSDHKEYLGDILTSSKHLLQLINDVLDLAKVESGKMEFRPESSDLAKMAREVCDTLRGLAASERLQVETYVDPEVATVVVDPARVKQILYNYLSNAIKFTPAGGRIDIRILPVSPALFRIDVEDTGVGIAAGDLDKLFVEFQQLDAGAAKNYQGTGLGLALTKKLAEAHGGLVAVRSTLGEGSVFSVILPRVMTIGPADEMAGPVMRVPSGNRTILVIDDDPTALKLASLALREMGYRPVCTTDPIEALRMVEADPPGIVIVDLLMPGVDGFEFVSRFRAMPAGRDVPVIVWTVKDLDAGERRRLQPSITGLVSKNMGGSNALVQELQRLLPRAASPPREAIDVA